MNVNLSKSSHIIFFGLFLSFLSVSISRIFSQIIPNPPFWLDTLSPLAAYGLLFASFNKFVWNWKIFRTMGIVSFPDLRGRWKGIQKSSYRENGKNVEIPCYLEITQSFSQICVRTYYQKSQSESRIAGFADANDQVYLYYTYDNDPNSLKAGSMQLHKGTAKLIFSPKNKSLIGSYFNSIGNQGDMEFKFESRETLFHF